MGAGDVAIDVLVNGESRSLPPGCSVQELVDTLDLDRRRIAIAVNREVVPRSSFSAHVLTAGDHVEILEAVGGG